MSILGVVFDRTGRRLCTFQIHHKQGQVTVGLIEILGIAGASPKALEFVLGKTSVHCAVILISIKQLSMSCEWFLFRSSAWTGVLATTIE
jgi:hypothetical protein